MSAILEMPAPRVLAWLKARRKLIATLMAVFALFCPQRASAALAVLEPGAYRWTATFDVSFNSGVVGGDLYGLDTGARTVTIHGITSCANNSCIIFNWPSTAGFSYSGLGNGSYQGGVNNDSAINGIEARWDSAGNPIFFRSDHDYYVRANTGSGFNGDPISGSTNLSFFIFRTPAVQVATTLAADAITWAFTNLTGTNSFLDYGQERHDSSYGGVSSFLAETFDIHSAIITLETAIGAPPVDAPPPTVETLSAMSKAVYTDVGRFHVPDYEQIDSIGDKSGVTAFAEAYYRAGENGGRGQLVIAIKGTTSSEDWIARNRSFVGLGEIDLDQSMQLIAGFVTDLLKDPRWATADVTFTGHSLGGAMAELLAKAAQVDAVAFNAPGTSAIKGEIRSTLSDVFSSVSGHSATQDILNIRQYGDLVSLVATQEYSVETVRIANERLIDAEPLACLYSCHSMDNLDRAIQAGAERTPGIVSPPRGVLAVLANLPQNLEAAALTKIFNLIVSDGDISWFDPTLTGDILQIDMNGSEARLAGLYLAGFDGSYPIEGLVDGSWQPLGTASPFALFDVPDLDLYRILNASGLVDDNGNYLVGLKFANGGTFTGRMGPPEGDSVPEPTTWGLWLLGFGAIGTLMRIKRRQNRPTSNLTWLRKAA